jgi:hypothetical protein
MSTIPALQKIHNGILYTEERDKHNYGELRKSKLHYKSRLAIEDKERTKHS